jgi:uncharacterized protein (TIGR03435 family)
MRSALLGHAMLLSFALTAYAQAPSFDVASLKPVDPTPPYPIDLGNTAHGKVTLTNVTLADCLKFAYKINNDAQIMGPDWIKSRTALFSIVGQAPADSTRDQLRLMMRTLLTERFQLSLRQEQRELQYLALVVDKKGAKMQPAREGADNAGSAVRAGKIVANNLSMTALGVFLARLSKMPVIDQTGLKGNYDVHVEWTLENKDAAATDVETGASMYAALTEQLGLRLEPRKGPLGVLAVEHAERIPIGN